MILFSYLRRLLHKKSGRWVWCCPILQAFIKKDWEGESCSISFYIHCLLHLLLGLLYGLVKWTSNMDWQPKNNILRTRGWIWERIASWIQRAERSNIRRSNKIFKNCHFNRLKERRDLNRENTRVNNIKDLFYNWISWEIIFGLFFTANKYSEENINKKR